MYDEFEVFDETNTGYPFQHRKSNLPSFPHSKVQDGKVPMTNIFLKKNLVCYDEDIFSELFFWQSNKCEIEDTSNFDYQKIKFSRFYTEENMSNGYNAYFAFKLGMDSSM